MKLFSLLLLSVLLCWTADLKAQHAILNDFKVPDSLRDLSFEALLEEYDVHFPVVDSIKNKELAQVVMLTYLAKAVSENDSLRIGRSYERLARLNDFNMDFLENCILYTENSEHENFPTVCYILAFIREFENGNYKEATEFILKANYFASKKGNEIYKENSIEMIERIRTIWIPDEDNLNQLLKTHLKTRKLFYKNDNSSVNRMFGTNLSDSYFAMANAMAKKNKIELAKRYLDTLYIFGEEHNIASAKLNYLGLNGYLYYKSKDYHKALEHTSAYLQLTDKDNLYGISRSSVVRGLILWELNEKDQAVVEFVKADSLYQITQDIFIELGDGYNTLIAYYKENGNKEKQLEYLNKLLEYDKELASNFNEIETAITRNYVIPELLEEKQLVINELAKRSELAEYRSSLYYVLLLILSGITSYFVVQRYRYKKRYEALMNVENDVSGEIKPVVKKASDGIHQLDAIHIERIANGLEKFEARCKFVDRNLTLKILAAEINTNSSYLSKYVNAVKGVNFSTYLSTLRIEHIIHRLQTEKKLRSYTIEAIALEAGFANTRSFSIHFKRITGINTSYFLKRMQNEPVRDVNMPIGETQIT